MASYIVPVLLVSIGSAWLFMEKCLIAESQIFIAVGGRVLVNGKPALNVHVAFHPLNGDRHGFCPVGRTDNDGVFHLTTSSGKDGAPAGEYNVTFIWPDPTVEIDECECPDPIKHDQFKGLYSSPDQSGYQAKVSLESNSFWFSVWRPRSDDPLP
jgi:hypothetical protein